MADLGNQGTENTVVLIAVDRPKAGEIETVAVTPGLQIVLDFDPAAARFAVEGDDFILTLEDGALVVFEGLVSAAQGDDAPAIHVSGINIDAGVLVEQILALAAEAGAEPIKTAAGEDGEDGEAEAGDGGGGSHYDDSFGELIAGLIKQGIIGETDLGFDLTGNSGGVFFVDAEFLSEGYLLNGGGFGSLGSGLPGGPGGLAGTGVPGGGAGDPDPLPDLAPLSGSGEVTTYTLAVNGMNIITNEANGNLEIPDELILYLADANQGAGLEVSGVSYDGVTDNAFISAAGDPMPASANTWAADGNDHIKFHIQGGHPLYEGSIIFEASDGLGGSGSNTIHIESFATVNSGGYWSLDGTGDDDILLGQDGRNEIDGFGGNDIIHGGHDSSGDILRGGDGDDVIFGGSGKDDLQGGAGDDTFLMRAGFSQDTVDGGAGDTDIISLDSVLNGADVANQAAVETWLTLTSGSITDADTTDGNIMLSADAAGTIDLGGGNEITFANIEQIDYALVG